MLRPYRGIILAAGLGTRLLPLTAHLPKPLLQMGPERLIETSLRRMVSAGIHEIAINLHHLPEQIPEVLGSGAQFGCELHYFHEPEILGTGGALKNAEAFLERGPFVVMNSDMVMDLDLSAMIKAHEQSQTWITLALRTEEIGKYGVLLFNEKNQVVDILGFFKKPAENAQAAHFTGVQIIEPRALAFFPEGMSESPRDLWMPLLKKYGPGAIHAYLYNGFFSDVGTWGHLFETHRIRYPQGYIAQDARLEGSVTLGPGVTIGARAILQGPISLEDVVVMPDSHVAPGAYHKGVWLERGFHAFH